MQRTVRYIESMTTGTGRRNAPCAKFVGMPTEKRSTTFRLSEDARRLLAALQAKLGVNQTAVLEMAIREKAKKEGVK